MVTPLRVNTSLSEILTGLQRGTGHPAFLATNPPLARDAEYVTPDNEIKTLTALEVSLQCYKQEGVAFINRYGKLPKLAKADWVHVISLIPHTETPDEKRGWAIFKGAGVPKEFQVQLSPIFLTEAEVPQWDGYVHVRHLGRKSSPVRPCLLAYRSAHIYAPELHITNWHTTESFKKHEDKVYAQTITPIAAPGWYARTNPWPGLDHTSYAIVEEAPGRCLQCYGASGVRKHFCHMGNDKEPRGLICVACFPTFVEQVSVALR